jgi:glycosyltransferase involved in cell wall biosynthesis
MVLISVITPTYLREDLLARCVESVLAQQVQDAQIEHLVVNDAGQPLAKADWMEDPRVRVLDTFRTERSVARNTGAALARGQWLYFLDDDDYALPGAFQALLDCANAAPDAVHVYGAYRVVNEALNTSSDVQPVVPKHAFPLMFAGEIIPLQASWIRRDAFFKVGCFDALFKAAEDNDLFRRLTLFGTTVGSPALVTTIRAEHRTTTSHWGRQQEFTIKSLEKCMSMPGAVNNLACSTRALPYWRGRCVRELAALTRHALRHGRFWLVGSRLMSGLRLSTRHLLRPAFWHGLRRLPQP